MDEKLKFSDEMLEKLTTEELVDLKVEVDELEAKIESMLEECDEAINS